MVHRHHLHCGLHCILSALAQGRSVPEPRSRLFHCSETLFYARVLAGWFSCGCGPKQEQDSPFCALSCSTPGFLPAAWEPILGRGFALLPLLCPGTNTMRFLGCLWRSGPAKPMCLEATVDHPLPRLLSETPWPLCCPIPTPRSHGLVLVRKQNPGSSVGAWAGAQGTSHVLGSITPKVGLKVSPKKS